MKANPWFEDFNWQELMNQNNANLEPPFKPDKAIQREIKELALNSHRTLIEVLQEIEG